MFNRKTRYAVAALVLAIPSLAQQAPTTNNKSNGKTVVPAFKPISKADLGKYVKGFSATLDATTGELKILGLVADACKGAIRFSVSDIDSDGKYAISAQAASNVTSCTQAATDACDRWSCTTSISGLVAGNLKLAKTGEVVFRSINGDVPEGAANDHSDESFSPKLSFTDADTIAKDAADKAAAEAQAQFTANCDAAEKGDDAALQQIIDSGASKEIVDDITAKNLESKLDAIIANVDAARTPKDLKALVKQLDQFGKDHADLSDKAADGLMSVIDALSHMENTGTSDITRNAFDSDRYSIAQDALNRAGKLAPKREDIKVMKANVSLDRVNWAAKTGNPMYFNSASYDVANAYYRIQKLAAVSQTPEVQAALVQYQDAFKPRVLSATPNVVHGPMGTAFDDVYNKQLNTVIDQQNKAAKDQQTTIFQAQDQILQNMGYHQPTPINPSTRPTIF